MQKLSLYSRLKVKFPLLNLTLQKGFGGRVNCVSCSIFLISSFDQTDMTHKTLNKAHLPIHVMMNPIQEEVNKELYEYYDNHILKDN